MIRFLDSKGNDILPRRDQINTKAALIPRMVNALAKAKQTIPAPLKLKQLSLDTPHIKQIAFSQHCFWTGESRIGALPGVLTTEAGWLDGREVTLVSYHEKTISTAKLTQQARAFGVADQVYTPDKIRKGYRKARSSDQKKQIQGTRYAKLKLTPEQACKVNAFCRTAPQKVTPFLTEKQRQQIK